MKGKKRYALWIAVCFLLFGCIDVLEVVAKEEKKVTILFTHDLHSRMDDGEKGGFARLKTLIDQKKAEKEGVFVLDGGDFSMGTLYQTLFETEASEICMLGKLGFDATTIGNHEFDYRGEGFSNMLEAAVRRRTKEELTLPMLTTSNINWKENTTKEDERIKNALEAYGAKRYGILERDGIRIGVFGVMGKDADISAPESGLTFQPIVEASKEVVKELKDEKVDMIVCLSHSGTNPEQKKSEDDILAKEVPEIDVIISGHTHTRLEKPNQWKDTYVVSAGEYGEALGEIEVTQKADGRWKLSSYTLHTIDERISSDASITEELEVYKERVNQEYLSKFGLTYNQVLVDNPVTFSPFSEFGKEMGEDSLGSLIADAYVYTVMDVEKEGGDPVAVALSPAGVIRGSFPKGGLTTADIFYVSSLGIGPDRIPGYPLVSVYLSGKELKTVAEIDVSVSPLMPSARLYGSGLHWNYNLNRMPLNRVTKVALFDDLKKDGREIELEDEKLYRVVAGLYSAQMLGAVENVSKGILKVTPKDKDGVPIQDFEEHIVYNQNGEEVKEWWAVAHYLQSFEQNEEGISVLPKRYQRLEGRKIEEKGKGIREIFGNPNDIAIKLYGLMLLVLATFSGLFVWVQRRRKGKLCVK